MSETEKSANNEVTSPGLEAEIPTDHPDNPDNMSGKAGQTSFEKVMEAALDSAGVANRSAGLAAASTENLLNAVGNLEAVTARARMTSMIVLFTSTLILVASAGVFFTVSAQLNRRLTEANSTLTVMTKRAVDLKADLDKLKQLDTLIAELEAQKSNENFEKMGSKIDIALSELKKQLASPPISPEKSSKSEEIRHKALMDQIRNVEMQSQSQGRIIAKLAEQFQASRGEASKILGSMRAVDEQLARLHEKQQLAPVPARAPLASVAAPSREREKQLESKNKDYIQYPVPNADNPSKAR